MTTAVVAEKPSVARDIAAVLGATTRGDGFFEGNGYVVTWAIGHLVALGQPHEIDPAWKRWSLSTLPMLPKTFPLVVVPATRSQYTVVRRILKERAVDEVVCATDAGREGELIFRYLYESAGCIKPVQRLWISSLTPDAIRNGFRRLESSTKYDGLADAAKGRSRADWLVGMNLSRAYSLSLDQEISVGRVQTPTLAMLVDRELSIRAFVPEDYLEVVAKFAPVVANGEVSSTTYEGTWFRPKSASEKEPVVPAHRRRLPIDGEEASAIVARAKTGRAAIESVKAETKRMAPPLLYDLTELQRHANRLYGLSAQKTLDIAQALYERHKLISYPRTDSHHLSQDIAATLPEVVGAIAGRYSGLLAPGTGTVPLGRRFVDDTKVSDHHAIIPNGARFREGSLSEPERKIYDLICRRLLQAWHEDHVYSITTVITAITTAAPELVVDRFGSRGTAIDRLGWKVLDIGGGKNRPPSTNRRGNGQNVNGGAEELEERDQVLPPGLVRGQPQTVLDARAVTKKTRPPQRFTEATLLTAMETAGRTLDEKEISDAMKDLGLGTPATRAQIIETLLRREYVVREGKALAATDKGIGLVSIVHPDVKSPAMTGEWEAKLKGLQRGQGDLDSFMAGIEAYVTDVVSRIAPSSGAPKTTRVRRAVDHGTPPNQASSSTEMPASVVAKRSPPARALPLEVPSSPRPPRPTTAPDMPLRELLHSAFGFAEFRPYQELVCRTATAGGDLLLVMPTGAGKSLCYQLPGIARGGTTLVVSPLIALMEDQVAHLSMRGFRADRIHSGRDRADSRQVCIEYLAGRLDFLFIAPERLRVPGFPEMLARRKPTLIAIDEAHCISQWGHDFRPDYRLLGQRLPLLRPTPILALTATATPEVQNDIVEQLGLESAERFIHGFRRHNLAIECVEMSPGDRIDAIEKLLADRTRRPAIVYAATRKSVEEIAAALGPRLASGYHAGMSAQERDRAQSAFLSGGLEIIVATTAFGMGIDKADVRTVVHAALPGSVEGYYQEIGRAGRDGKPSSAILLHSYVDRKTHEFFHERDYPEPAVLQVIYGKLKATPVDRERIRLDSKMEAEAFDKAAEKLAIHGGLVALMDGMLTRGVSTWKKPYLAQRDHKLAQLVGMARFAEEFGCRMVQLVRHFGDQEDSGEKCGLCDSCAPERSVARHFREPSAGETASLARILSTLAADEGQATGRLHRDSFPDGKVDRKSFEHLLGSLIRAGLVISTPAMFEKDGKSIPYQRASLTPAGRAQGAHLGGISIGERSTKPKWKKGGGTKSPEDARRAYFAQKNRKKKGGKTFGKKARGRKA